MLLLDRHALTWTRPH